MFHVGAEMTDVDPARPDRFARAANTNGPHATKKAGL
jgi:hypothetical protein